MDKVNCNTDYNIHTDPKFLLRCLALPITGILILKSAFKWHGDIFRNSRAEILEIA